jgi:hypothetical protein
VEKLVELLICELLTFTTGFVILIFMEKRAHASSPEKRESRPWREAAKDLNPGQRDVAEIASFRIFLEKCNRNAKGQLPWLQEKEQGTDKEIKNRYVTGLLDAYVSLPLGEEGRKKFEEKWGEKSHYLKGQVESMLPALDGQRDRIFTEAKSWGVKEKRKQVGAAHRVLGKLPKEQRNIFYGETTLEAEKAKTKATRWGVTVGTNVALSLLLEIPASAAGTGLVDVGLMEHMDTKSLVAVAGASYAFWGYGLRKSIKANMDSLEQTGMGTSPFSKLAFDRAQTEKGQKFGVAAGYVGWEAAKEIPYYAGALGGVAAGALNSKEMLIFLAGANVAAGVYEMAVAKGLKHVVRRVVQRAERREKNTDNA